MTRSVTAVGLQLGAALVSCALVAGCAPTPPPPPPPPATYPLTPRPVRNGEVPLAGPATPQGDTSFELIGLTTGMASVVGSHTEWPAKGQYVRIRLVITNTGRNSVPFDANRQLLRTTDGVEHPPDPQAMLIKRQPGEFDLGATDRLEFDLYYDVPKDASPSALHAFGGPSLADFSDATGVVIPIKPA